MQPGQPTVSANLRQLLAEALPHTPPATSTDFALTVLLQEADAGRMMPHPSVTALLECLRKDPALEAMIANGELFCSEEVLHELERQDDELLQWAKAQARLFVAMDAAIEAAVKRVVAIPNAVKGTSTDNSADPFVVAVAIVRTATVVSRESAGSPQRPKIPYLCGQLGVTHQSLEQFVTGQGWSFA